MPRFNEKEFEAEQDARTLMEADKIRADSKKMSAAQKALKKIEAEAKQSQEQAARLRMEKKVGKKMKEVLG